MELFTFQNIFINDLLIDLVEFLSSFTWYIYKYSTSNVITLKKYFIIDNIIYVALT